MKYRRLGSTGLRVSVIGLGTWQFGGEWAKDFSQAEADRMLARAKELGINLIDTAECYGDHTSERLIGDFISRCDDREYFNHGLGHPIGMSGARLILTMAYDMRERGLSLGLATLCISGGQGLAVVLERA